MMKKIRAGFFIAAGLGVTVLAFLLLRNHDIAILNPKGTIAQEQLNLIVLTTLLSLIVIVPVFGFTFFVAWKYRAGNKKAQYKPDWDHNKWAEIIWWLVPLALISILAVVTWTTSHTLDPFRALDSKKKPLTIEVVALQWKWLFIYPEQKIASVNFVQFPEDRPVTFKLTSDAPMNSFWIPKLGGQMYAMAGMETKLHLQATEAGDYNGASANISGEGFAGMHFTARASSETQFDTWVKSVQKSDNFLNNNSYAKLAAPSKDVPRSYYILADRDVYDKVIMKYMTPGMENELPQTSETHEQHHE